MSEGRHVAEAQRGPNAVAGEGCLAANLRELLVPWLHRGGACERRPRLHWSRCDLHGERAYHEPELLAVIPGKRHRSEREGEQQDDGEPSLDGWQVPQGPEHRRHHRDKQEESNETVLDQHREEDVVGYHLLVDRGFDGCLERS